MKIAVIGTGFVGVVTAAVYASFGQEVVGLDIDEHKVELLRQSKVPFFEPDLEELLKEQQSKGNLTFTSSYPDAIQGAEVVVIAVNTPSQESGEVNLQYLFAACESMAPHLRAGAIVVVKSTVPPGTLKVVTEKIQSYTDTQFSTASVPEFLKEGTAVADTLHPDRIVIGADEDSVFRVLEELHEPLQAPIVRVSPESAQMAKYSANAYLATRITFINQVADLCETTGADVMEVIQAIGLDKRIGSHYWYPGFGYGGSCFPKDVKELAAYSRKVKQGNNLFNKLDELNEQRPELLLQRMGEHLGGWQGKRVAVLGLSFKPNTNDMREAPSLRVIPFLQKSGAQVRTFDPQATDTAQQILSNTSNITFCQSIDEACQNTNVILALIEWPQIAEFDYASVRIQKQQWFIDARNQFSPEQVRTWGYEYLGIGRA